MSEKELLYVEDCLNQTKHMRQKCGNNADAIQDRELKAFVKDLEARYQSVFNQIFKILQ
ncbi:MAG: hypothetical protein PHT03_06320 [Bacilli bacterium]|nr:hypothetical protein [Bacilli bacterium]MDD4388906.1 hypothetical protein [Bacilli bacterium]